MAVHVKALAAGKIDQTSSSTPTAVYTASKAAIVKTMRFVNTGGTARTLNVQLTLLSGTKSLISPSSVSIAAGSMYVDTDEVTLGAGDKIEGWASAANDIQFVLSGVERDEP
jgi:hypothetical protein